MSEKDKNTIIIAAVALLIFGIIMLGIKPGIANLKEAKAQNVELSATKEEMKNEIDSLPTYKTNLASAKADYASTSNRVFGDLTNDKIHDAVVDELVTPLGLQVESLSIGETVPKSVLPYTVNGEASGISEGNIQLTQISISVVGSTDQLISLIDELNTNEGTYLEQVSFSNTADANSGVSLTFYMVLADSFD